MKKNLFLMTALFAGTIISNDICAGNMFSQNGNQGTLNRNHTQMIESNEPQEEGTLKRTHAQMIESNEPQEEGTLKRAHDKSSDEQIDVNYQEKLTNEKLLTKMSKYYILDYCYNEQLVLSAFDDIKDRRKAKKILENIIAIHQSYEYKEGGLCDWDKKYMFDIIFGNDSFGYKKYTEYCTHDRLEILEFMTKKSIPAAVEIAASEDYKNKMPYYKRDCIIPYILGSADDDELNFRKKVVQEYMTLVTSVNNSTITADSMAYDAEKSFFESTNEQDLEQRKQEIKKRYNLKHLF